MAKEVEEGEKMEGIGEAGGRMETEEERKELGEMGGGSGQRGREAEGVLGREKEGSGEADGPSWTSPVVQSIGTPQNQLLLLPAMQIK